MARLCVGAYWDTSVGRVVLEAQEGRYRHRWETGQEVCVYLMHR